MRNEVLKSLDAATLLKCGYIVRVFQGMILPGDAVHSSAAHIFDREGPPCGGYHLEPCFLQ